MHRSPDPEPSESTSSIDGSTGIPSAPVAGPGWTAAYAMHSLAGIVSRYEDPRTRDAEWIAIARTLARRLGREAPLPDHVRPEASHAELAEATVFLLGATSTSPSGCLGHVEVRPRRWSIDGRGGVDGGPRIRGGDGVAEAVLDATVSAVRPLAPDVVVPEYEIHIPVRGEGDSHALACGVAAMHALLRCGVPVGIAATGGYDRRERRFTTVPVDTLGSKLAAAERWGLRRLVVVAGQAFPGGRRPTDIEVIEVPADPAALPLLVLELTDPDTADGVDEAVVDAWRRALALYDLRVARNPREPLASVMATTAAFVDPLATALESDPESDLVSVPGTSPARGPVPTRSQVRQARDRLGMDPILAGIAADLRSRVLLHAGRSVEAAWWDGVARGLHGVGDLPEGVLGDHLLLQQPSHRSVLAIDLGDLDDPAAAEDGAVEGVHPHAMLDRVIERLDSDWLTRHQALLALFASNTRWRRRLYLARRDLDPERFRLAEEDLFRWRSRWEELLDRHARRSLGMGDTDLRRQWNYVLEHAVSETMIRDAASFVKLRTDAEDRRIAAARIATVPGLPEDLRAREAAAFELGAFDLRGVLQWQWLEGRFEPDSAVAEAARRAVRASGEPHTLGVVEWWWRLLHEDPSDGARASRTDDLRAIHERLVEALGEHLRGHDGASGPAGVTRIVALRRAAMLDADGVAFPGSSGEATDWVSAIEPPSTPDSLRDCFEDLVRRPELLLVRVPY